MDHFETRFSLENDTGLIPPLVAHLEEDLSRLKLCEPSGLVLLGVAMHESLTNAMLHGNLELRLGAPRGRREAILPPLRRAPDPAPVQRPPRHRHRTLHPPRN